ncbi:MAG: hypothetical protein JWM11_1256, partial [Planctomycetaceae bacterium]|nr:hypothetical protein [Planctomycetaceae bacterium]
ISLAKLSCLIGLNGSGKSTVLQFIDFLSQLVRGDIKGWLDERKWKSADLRSKISKRFRFSFTVAFVDDENQPLGRWTALYSPSLGRCRGETFDFASCSLSTTKRTVVISDLPTRQDKEFEITFDYTGSILSALKESILPPCILECKRFIEKIKSLDLLAPERLRQRTRESSGTLGLGGQNLASFIHEMDIQKRRELLDKLKSVYPQLQSIQSKSIRSGWKQLGVVESFDSNGASFTIATEARHMNDGMLRLIAILAELQSDNCFLLFDEIENGINPELVEFVIDQLVNAEQQVLVTTHSPMILNYLDDNVATRGVIYLYKTKAGHTKSIPFFSIPSLAEKLTMMGPGEVFVDTDLKGLADEIELLAEVE